MLLSTGSGTGPSRTPRTQQQRRRPAGLRPPGLGLALACSAAAAAGARLRWNFGSRRTYVTADLGIAAVQPVAEMERGAGSGLGRIRIRAARESDAAVLAPLVSSSFVEIMDTPSQNYPAWYRNGFVELYKTSMEQEMKFILTRGLQAKKSAARLPVDEKVTHAARSTRMWTCLVAESVDTGIDGHPCELLGSITVCVTKPEALLPPPFPSFGAADRLYLSNLCVASQHRKRGIACALIDAGETLARRWGYASSWLHVDHTNDRAAALYRKVGYRFWKEDPKWMNWLSRRTLLVKVLPPRRHES